MPDIILNGLKGKPANKLIQHGMDPAVLRPYIDDDGVARMAVPIGNGQYKAVLIDNATLRKDEWISFDETILRTARYNLVGISDLESRGLVYDIPNGMGSTILEYEDVGEFTAAEMTMDGISKTVGDRAKFELGYLPLPITHKDFQINARVLAASRTRGAPLDTTQVELATRQVSLLLEQQLFTATSYTYGSGTVYSYLNFPNRNTVSIGTDWDDAAATGATILATVREMIQAAVDDNFFGPFVLYIPGAYTTVMGEDYTAGYSKTIKQRILELDAISEVKVAAALTANNVVLVQMTPDVVRLVRGMELQTVDWDEQAGLATHYKIMTIKVPQIRADQSGQCGIVHCS